MALVRMGANPIIDGFRRAHQHGSRSGFPRRSAARVASGFAQQVFQASTSEQAKPTLHQEPHGVGLQQNARHSRHGRGERIRQNHAIRKSSTRTASRIASRADEVPDDDLARNQGGRICTGLNRATALASTPCCAPVAQRGVAVHSVLSPRWGHTANQGRVAPRRQGCDRASRRYPGPQGHGCARDAVIWGGECAVHHGAGNGRDTT